MNNLLVPIDFSKTSIHALSVAKQIARMSGGTIYLIHIIALPTDRYSFIMDTQKDELKDIYTSQFIDIVSDKLNEIKDYNESLTYEIKDILIVGDPYDEIVKFVKKENINMIFMGAKGIMNREGLYLGSLNEKIIRSISCPVLTVNKFSSSNHFTRIIYAVDLRLDHTEIMEDVKKIQMLFNSKIDIVIVNIFENDDNNKEYMEELQTIALKNNLNEYSINIYNHPNEEYGIIEFADQKKADLIVVGLHEKSGVRRLISGGLLAEEIINHSFRPIMTYYVEVGKAKDIDNKMWLSSR